MMRVEPEDNIPRESASLRRTFVRRCFSSLGETMGPLLSVLLLLLATSVPLPVAAEPKPAIAIASDGFPSGQESPEGAAADFARAFIDRSPAAFRRVSIRVYNQGPSGKEYDGFLSAVVADMAAEKVRATPSPDGPKAIEKVFAVRHLSRSGPASYGYASFGFQDVAFVDIGVRLHGGQRALNRILVIMDRDGRWYVHPAPHVSPLLGQGLESEPPSNADFSEAYQLIKQRLVVTRPVRLPTSVAFPSLAKMLNHSVTSGTNRLKGLDEIKEPSRVIAGVAQFKARLASLAKGEQIFWSLARYERTLSYPEDEVVADLLAFAAERDFALVIEK